MFTSVSLVSAWNWDNVKQFDKDKGSYGEIKIKNAFGLGKDLADYELEENTDYCMFDCYAEGKTKLYVDGRLFDEMNFYDKNGDDKTITSTIYIKVKGDWVEYNGEYLDKGNYQWRIEGTKKADESVDWIGESFGERFTEWAWWNANFYNKKKIVITENNNTELANYSIKLEFDYDSDMLPDFADIRFTDTDETTLLNYYIENYTASNNATVWVKMASNITASSTKNIYMYYNNVTSVVSLSNFTASFLFADDFEIDTSANWNYTNCDGGFAISGGKMRITETSGAAGYQCTVSPKDAYQYLSTNYEVTSKSEAPGICTYIITSAGYMATNRTYPYYGTQLAQSSNGAANYLNLLQVNAPAVTTDLNKSATSRGFSVNTNYTLSLQLYGTYAKAIKEVSNSPSPGDVRMELPYNGLTYPLSGVYGISAYEGCSASATTDIHEWRVRPFVINEPTYSFEGEQTGNVYVDLNTPLNGVIATTFSPTFNCSGNTNGTISLVNMSLWHNNTGIFQLEETNLTITGTTNTTTLNSTISNPITWTCQACASDGTCSFAGENRTLLLDPIAPDLNVTYPVGVINYSYVGMEQTFNWTVSDTLGSLSSCWYDYNGTNTTVTCLDNSSSFLVETGNYNLTMWANDTAGNMNSSYREWTYDVFENNRSFNEYSYQTQSETFSINVTATNPTAVLIYNGTSHTGTRTGTGPYVFNTTFDIPSTADTTANQTFYWDVTVGGTAYSTTTHQQNISEIVFAQCNATYNQAYLNISFLDESDSSIIKNGTIPLFENSYYLGGGSQTKNFTFTNNTGNQNYSFCFSPVDRNVSVDFSLQYEDQEGTYPQRTYEDVVVLSNSSTDLVLYLLSSTDGIYVTFQVINAAEQPIEDAHVTATRVIDSSTVTVGEGDTGADGGITFWLNPNFEHTFTFNATGYSLYTTDLTPTQTSYTIYLGGSGTVGNVDLTKGITQSIYPTHSSLFNDTTYEFNYTLGSTHYTVDEFGICVSSGNGTALGCNVLTTNGGTVRVNANTGSYTSIIMDYYYEINGSSNNLSTFWYVMNTGGTDWSIKNFFNDIDTYADTGMFGINSFSIAIIAFISVFIFVGILSYKFGLVSPAAISVVAFAVIFIFDVGLGLLEPLNPIGNIPYFPTIFTGIVMLAAFAREAFR